ncbi:hypothetical protein T12_198 [Trichinella patagoniensis]|uniref:Uncharacterized protein n=1 Tax=Trichinella patagoniensis TaxID=990121 RepID=A0A0V1A240_9BILA|nr:hypothetical protein T12_198 [Trichinella patagoniensis]
MGPKVINGCFRFSFVFGPLGRSAKSTETGLRSLRCNSRRTRSSACTAALRYSSSNALILI